MTPPMANATERVRRHRQRRGLLRVEVEVPSSEDADLIRRFAAERRAGLPAGVASLLPDDAALHDDARRAIRIFAAAVAKAANPDAIARALRVAANYRDVIDHQARAVHAFRPSEDGAVQEPLGGKPIA